MFHFQNLLKMTKPLLQSCFEVKITNFSEPLLVTAWNIPDAYRKTVSYIRRLETKESHSIVRITYVSSNLC